MSEHWIELRTSLTTIFGGFEFLSLMRRYIGGKGVRLGAHFAWSNDMVYSRCSHPATGCCLLLVVRAGRLLNSVESSIPSDCLYWDLFQSWLNLKNIKTFKTRWPGQSGPRFVYHSNTLTSGTCLVHEQVLSNDYYYSEIKFPIVRFIKHIILLFYYFLFQLNHWTLPLHLFPAQAPQNQQPLITHKVVDGCRLLPWLKKTYSTISSATPSTSGKMCLICV